MHVALIIPSHGKPQAAFQAVASAVATATLPHTSVHVVTCDDDPAYDEVVGLARWVTGSGSQRVWRPVSLSRYPADHPYMQMINDTARRCTPPDSEPPSHYVLMPDVCRCRSDGWDADLARACGPAGIAYPRHVVAPAPIAVAASRASGALAPRHAQSLRDIYTFWAQLRPLSICDADMPRINEPPPVGRR